MRLAWAWVLALGFSGAVYACVGDQPVGPSDSGGPDGTVSDGSATDSPAVFDGGGDAPPGSPTHPPTSLAFTDQNPVKDNAAGTVTIGKAVDESDVTSYKLYWGLSTDGGSPIKLTQVADVPKTGSAVTYNLSAAVPQGAAYLMAVSSNAQGEMTSGPFVTPIDNYPVHTDLSGDAGVNMGTMPSAAIDSTNHKLIVATTDLSGEVVLFRCNLDGTACAMSNLGALTDAGSAGTGMNPSVVIDTAYNHILVALRSGTNHLVAYRCDLNGQNCTMTDITTQTGGPTLGSTTVSAAMDSTNNSLDVAVMTGSYGRTGLYRCDLQSFNVCTLTDLTTLGLSDDGAGNNTGYVPSAAFANAKLYVSVVNEASSAFKPGLFVASSTTSCTYSDVSAGQGNNSGGSGPWDGPSVVVDTTNGKVVVASHDQSTAGNGKLTMFRCDLTGASCTHTDISAGQPTDCGWYPHAAIDVAGAKLYVATWDVANSGKPGLFQCALDGTNCSYVDMSAGQGANSGDWISLVLDSTNKRVLVVTENDATGNSNLSLFSIGMW